MVEHAPKEPFFLIDSPEDEFFERVVSVISTALVVPACFVSFFDENRQFFMASRGFPEPFASQRETPLDRSFCVHVRDMDRVLAVEDAHTHPLVKDHPAIVEFGVVAYIGYPLHDTDGQAVGSLCAIDQKWRQWRERDHSLMRHMAAMIDSHIRQVATLTD